MPRSPLSSLTMSVPAADGLVLRGQLTYPAGRPGSRFPLAVLAHEYPGTRDTFAPLCLDLQAAGYATLAFDLRGLGDSIWSPAGLRVAPTPAEPTMDAFGAAFMGSAGAMSFAHIADDIVRVAAWGLYQSFIDGSRLLLVGGSVGGTGVLLAAPRLRERLQGIVTFGAAGAPAHAPDAMQSIRRNCESLAIPMLLTTSEGDPFDGANNVRTWSKGLAHVTTRIVPGAAHAMGIYHDVRRDVVAFVRRLAAGGSVPRRTTRAAARRGRR